MSQVCKSIYTQIFQAFCKGCPSVTRITRFENIKAIMPPQKFHAQFSQHSSHILNKQHFLPHSKCNNLALPSHNTYFSCFSCVLCLNTNWRSYFLVSKWKLKTPLPLVHKYTKRNLIEDKFTLKNRIKVQLRQLANEIYDWISLKLCWHCIRKMWCWVNCFSQLSACQTWAKT